jgi:hypothetical protein
MTTHSTAKAEYLQKSTRAAIALADFWQELVPEGTPAIEVAAAAGTLLNRALAQLRAIDLEAGMAVQKYVTQHIGEEGQA